MCQPVVIVLSGSSQHNFSPDNHSLLWHISPKDTGLVANVSSMSELFALQFFIVR